MTIRWSLLFAAIHGLAVGVFGLPDSDAEPQMLLSPHDVIPNLAGKLGPISPVENSKFVHRQKITYGPFTIPSMVENDGMKAFVANQVAMPCENCVLTRMVASLESADGETEDAQDGKWLHHVVLANTQRRNVVCPRQPERFFASGNERTVIDFPVHDNVQTGYKIAKGDTVAMNTELMNGQMRESDFYIAIVYDFILLDEFKGPIKLLTPVWLDIGDVDGACVRSKVPALMDTDFAIQSRPWVSTIEGDIVFAGGHVHDGGINIDLVLDTEIACSSHAQYGTADEKKVATGEMRDEMGHMAGPAEFGHRDARKKGSQVDPTARRAIAMSMRGEHVVNMTVCHDLGSLRIGQRASVNAIYDTEKRAPMLRGDGSPEPIMGIVLMYVTNGDPVH